MMATRKPEKYDRDKNRDRKYRTKYGITLADYDRMFEEQNGRCWMCQRPGNKFGRGRMGRLHVDHNHKTGKVRGLLCYCCNGILGLANDSTETLARGISYLMGQ